MKNGVAALSIAVILVGCAAPSSPAAARWSPPPPAPWPPAPPPAPFSMGAREPWWSGGAPTAPPRAEVGSFLVVLDLRGPGGAARLPDAHATLARLGGVQRTPPLWEIAPQPGGGLGSVAAVLERELCAEDLVVVYRARNGGMERSDFAGHRACREEPAPLASPPPRAAPPPPTPARRDPFYDRF